MQRQFLYNFLCTHESVCHGVPAKSLPRDKQSPVWVYRGEGNFFLMIFLYCFEDLFIPEWKPDLPGRIGRLPKQR